MFFGFAASWNKHSWCYLSRFALWYGHLILAKLNERGKKLVEKITEKIVVQIRVIYSGEATGKHQPVSKTLMMALHHLCACRFWNTSVEGWQDCLVYFHLAVHSCSFWGGLLIMVWTRNHVLSFHPHLLWCITCCSLWKGNRVTHALFISPRVLYCKNSVAGLK